MTATAVGYPELLTRLAEASPTTREKGTALEQLTKDMLAQDPLYAQRFSDVWLWQEWPGRAGRTDTGVDLVAEQRDTGALTAIQCKFFGDDHRVHKRDIDSFLAELGRSDYADGMIVSTSASWSSTAEKALEDLTKPVVRFGLEQFAALDVDWSAWVPGEPAVVLPTDFKTPRAYQAEAIADVIEGLRSHDRGRLIMACGTGKTFTSLRLAEQQVPVGGSILFLVPSIALLQQTLVEWTAQAITPIRAFAVCSDTSVGKARTTGLGIEDLAAVDLGYPATTDPAKLATALRSAADGAAAGGALGDTPRTTVVFATYQSIDVVKQAQDTGLADFDLIICDEAHRTTGIDEPGSTTSPFVRVHDNSYLRAAKRLYMTATPRLYVEESKTKAAENDVAVFSMDDEETYGPQMHHLGFGKAVELGALADYKVLVLAVDEASVSRSFQDFLARDGSDIPLPDVAKIVGIWNGLSKSGADGKRLAMTDTSPMNRAVAFAANINESKLLTERINRVSGELTMHTRQDDPLTMTADHVDGTFNITERSALLRWLQQPAGERSCRILSNARCLTEGVDVPSLDAVMFLNPRNSQVDVVQAVGRVMRIAPGKEYGYIILPIAVSVEDNPATALNDNKKYKVVWDVLQALRAHDDRFEAMVNKIAFEPEVNTFVDVIGVGGTDSDEDGPEGTARGDRGVADTLFSSATAADWEQAIFARMVRKVGSRTYWEDWAADVRDIASRQTTRIRAILDADTGAATQFEDFVAALRANLNGGISENDAVDMLVQHMITTPVFDALFADYDFSMHNPVSQVMQAMLDALHSRALEAETEPLADFYRDVRVRAAGIESAAGKQRIITELYERFFKLAFPATSESLGIVYTPVEIVDFMIRAVDDALRQSFGVGITDEGVHVLDPFTGTGTFLTRLLESGRIAPADLLRKYTSELHANEILLMPYYIAAINIEATMHGLLRGRLQRESAQDGEAATVGGEDGVGYVPFDGIVLTDTFQMTEDGDTIDERVFTSNNERAAAQNALDIRVILGNPPYSVGQTSGNDNNANLSYPTLDASIRDTYAKRSTAQNKNSLYDSYIRAIRWASNRIRNSAGGGVVCYVSNGGYIDGNTADGLRRTLVDEFHEIYVLNLRGNARTAGELRRKEQGNVFGEGSKTTVAILLLVKRPGAVEGQARLHYKDIGDYLSREDKLRIVDESDLATIDWRTIAPNEYGDWINQRDPNYESYPLIADRKSMEAIFDLQSAGLQANRDAWVYSYSHERVAANSERMIRNYNAEVDRWITAGHPLPVEDFVTADETQVSWARSLRNALKKGRRLDFAASNVRMSLYRPFSKQHSYFAELMNHERGRMPSLFPGQGLENFGYYIVGPGNPKEFSAVMTDQIPDLSLWGSGQGQFFARYHYVPASSAEEELDLARLGDGSEEENVDSSGFRRVDNITDWALASYRSTYGADVTKDDIFFYVYGLLHSPEYRTRYAAELKKSLPRIPQVEGRGAFDAFVATGKRLSDLHIGYEAVEPYPLTEAVAPSAPENPFERYQVEKLRYGGKSGAWDKSMIRYNRWVTLSGIPLEAQDYLLGSRSGIDWILERYRIKTDKPSGIVNDPNDWSREHDDPRYIIDLIGRVTTLSLETLDIVGDLPPLELDG